jgi:ORF6N domain
MENNTIISDEGLASKIYFIRGQKVMLDHDLAELYAVETKRLKEQVKRNLVRFPDHFMFVLTKDENEILRSQNATLRHGEHSKYPPYVFTEHGVLMLSNVLKSERAALVSIRIIDIFIKLRAAFANQTDIWLAIEKIKNKLDNQDKNMEIVFRYLDELIEHKNEVKPRKRIGYKSDEL